MSDLTGKTAVVTGAASGIGLAMATLFAETGMNVVMTDIEAAALSAAADNLGHSVKNSLGNKTSVIALAADVASAEAMDELAEQVYARFGSVQLLCNNAGVFASGASWECSDADYRWLLDVNVLGIANGIRSFVPRMIAQGDNCHVVNTASMAGLTTKRFSSVYCMSKAAALSLSECRLLAR